MRVGDPAAGGCSRRIRRSTGCVPVGQFDICNALGFSLSLSVQPAPMSQSTCKTLSMTCLGKKTVRTATQGNHSVFIFVLNAYLPKALFFRCCLQTDTVFPFDDCSPTPLYSLLCIGAFDAYSLPAWFGYECEALRALLDSIRNESTFIDCDKMLWKAIPRAK